MPAMEILSHLFKINPRIFSSLENLVLETEVFIRICEELKEIYKAKNKEYFSLINIKLENDMIETKFLKFVVDDILATEEYSLAGIAYYTQIPEEVVCDVASGKNQMPSLLVSRKIIELHRSVRPDLYKGIINKIKEQYLETI